MNGFASRGGISIDFLKNVIGLVKWIIVPSCMVILNASESVLNRSFFK